MAEMNRRTFMGTTAKAVLVGGMMAQGRVFGANDRVGVAVVGLNGRGKSHIDGFGNKPDSDIVLKLVQRTAGWILVELVVQTGMNFWDSKELST